MDAISHKLAELAAKLKPIEDDIKEAEKAFADIKPRYFTATETPCRLSLYCTICREWGQPPFICTLYVLMFPYFAFFGRPGDRNVDSRWCLDTMFSTQVSRPYGTLLFTELRMILRSSSLSIVLIHLT